MGIRPIHYALRFEPDLDKRRFVGRAVIDARADAPTKTITMNAAELAVRSCTVTCAGQRIGSRTRLVQRAEELVITTRRPVLGPFTVSIDFAGILNDRLLGFYFSTYTVRGRKKQIATTQFEAADARRAFPCWDEPSAKATFDVTIVAPASMRAVSNMPESSCKTLGRSKIHTFARTPPMSTYLLYMGVGDFESISTQHRNVRISVITTRGNAARGRFALGLARRLLAEYERYFETKYPLPKLDLLAIPDFAAGAMENWGAITFRESLLLHDDTSSTRTRQLIAEVVSHEIAHQWFGNLVTMKWWNDLWLNESFATFMATKFVDSMYPKWAMWDQFAEETVNRALRLDSLRSTHAIDVRVKSPAQIREIFDAISYDKGGSVLQMIERVVGEPAFRRGLVAYLNKFAYGNAEGSDLWREIGRVARQNLVPFVNSWIRQPGYPLLDIKRNRRSVRIRQSLFCLSSPRRRSTRLWHVPVFVRARRAPKMISARCATLPISGSGVINPARAAFVRVRYGRDHLNALGRLAAASRLQSPDAWMIQGDILELCLAGLCDVRSYLDFADSCSSDQSYLVSSGIAKNLRFLHRVSAGTPFEWRLRRRVDLHHAAMHARLGWEPRRGEPHTDSVLRGRVIETLGVTVRDGAVVAEAESRFERFVRRPGSLVADLREPTCSIAVSSGGSRAWRRAKSLYLQAQTQEEKMRFLTSMCATRAPDLLSATLEFSQTSHVRSQNMHLPVACMAANPHGAPLVWPWIKKNWNKISKKVGSGNPLLARMITPVAIAARDASAASDLERFFERHPTPGTKLVVAQSAETIRVNSLLRSRMGREFESIC